MSSSVSQYHARYGKTEFVCEEIARSMTILEYVRKRDYLDDYLDRGDIAKRGLGAIIVFPLDIAHCLWILIERIIEIGKTCFTKVGNKGGRLCHHLISLILFDPLEIILSVVNAIVFIAGSILGLFSPLLFLDTVKYILKTHYLFGRISLYSLQKLVPSPEVPKNPTPHPFESFILSMAFREGKEHIELWQNIPENQPGINESRERLIKKIRSLFNLLQIQDQSILKKIASNDSEISKKLKLSKEKELDTGRINDMFLYDILDSLIKNPYDFNFYSYIKDKMPTNERLVRFSKALIKIFHFSDKQHAKTLYSADDRASIKKIEEEFPIVYGLGVAIY